MFLTDCQACGLRELRGPRSIELLVNHSDGATGHAAGVDLVYRCNRCTTLNILGATTGTTATSTPMSPQELAVANAA